MKVRLFGDLETISIICKIIMNVPLFSALSRTVCSLERFRCTDALWRKYSGHINICTNKQIISKLRFIVAFQKFSIQKCVLYCTYSIFLEEAGKGTFEGEV